MPGIAKICPIPCRDGHIRIGATHLLASGVGGLGKTLRSVVAEAGAEDLLADRMGVMPGIVEMDTVSPADKGAGAIHGPQAGRHDVMSDVVSVFIRRRRVEPR